MTENNLKVVQSLLDIKMTAPWDRAYAGEWLTITIVLTRLTNDSQSVILANVQSDDPQIQININLLQHGVEIRPGESYRFQLPILISRPMRIDLASIVFVCTQLNPQGVPDVIIVKSRSRQLEIKPSLSKEIAVRLDTLCKYDEGTKVRLTLKHNNGTSRFQDLVVTLGPESAIRAGKPTIQRALFVPQDEETISLVVDQEELEMVMVASIDGQRPEMRQIFRVEPPASMKRKRFRYLEPRRLAKDQIKVLQILGDNKLDVVKKEHANYLIEDGTRYRMTIKPTHPTVMDVKINEIFGVVQIDKKEQYGGEWHFEFEASYLSHLRRRKRLFYEVVTPEGIMTGAIPLCLKPSPWRYWQAALALGVATALQGVAAVGKLFGQGSHSILNMLSDFKLAEHYQVFFLFSIPIFWLGLRGFDWLQYQFSK